jgi:DNA-binding CsgD family transcriptional regulator
VQGSSRTRARAEIVRLLHRGLGVHDFSLAAARALHRAVSFDGVCVLTIDPATLLPTSETVEHGLPPATMPRMTEIEVAEDDYNKFAVLARASRPAASLSEATDGGLDRCLRQRELRRPNGLGDELRAALVADSGTWGGITLLRETGRAFAPAETSLLGSLSAHLAEGLRRAVLSTALSEDPEAADAGLLVLADDNSIELSNTAAQRWLDELGVADSSRGHLPLAVVAVAGRARLAASGHAPDDAIARARVATPSGRWLLVRGSMVGHGPDARAAVILESAPSPELAPLIAAAYGLTDRERLVTEHVARGHSTNEIASHLFLSPYTVQDHLKAIFEKTGVNTRGELVARLFFEHYAPRIARGHASRRPAGSHRRHPPTRQRSPEPQQRRQPLTTGHGTCPQGEPRPLPRARRCDRRRVPPVRDRRTVGRSPVVQP